MSESKVQVSQIHALCLHYTINWIECHEGISRNKGPRVSNPDILIESANSRFTKKPDPKLCNTWMNIQGTGLRGIGQITFVFIIKSSPLNTSLIRCKWKHWQHIQFMYKQIRTYLLYAQEVLTHFLKQVGHTEYTLRCITRRLIYRRFFSGEVDFTLIM